MGALIRRTGPNISKYFILFALVFNGLSGTVSVEKKQSTWKKVKKTLRSKPAKIAYGVIATMLVGPYFIVKIKTHVATKERERSLRNGRIVFSWLGEARVSQNSRESQLVTRFRDRYMPNSRDSWFDHRPYYYYTFEQRTARGVEIIIGDKGILQGDPTSLFRKICCDIQDMNVHAASNGNPTNWTAVIEKQEPRDSLIFPLKDDFDVPRYQVRITIPAVS